MPSVLRHPGIYIEEATSAVRPIAGVSTSNTAFVGFFSRGPMQKQPAEPEGATGFEPVKVTSFEEFERRFGGYRDDTEAAYQVATYFLNGGSVAYIVRIAGGDYANAKRSFGKLEVEAVDPGAWGNNLQIAIVKTPGANPADAARFKLKVEEIAPGTKEAVAVEEYLNLTLDPADRDRYAINAINAASRLIRVALVGDGKPGAPPADEPDGKEDGDEGSESGRLGASDDSAGSDGDQPQIDDWKEGIEALRAVQPDVFNLLCVPGADHLPPAADPKEEGADPKKEPVSIFKSVIDFAAGYCERQRAFLLVDPPASVTTDEQMQKFANDGALFPAPSANAAIYFPRLRVPDPLQGGMPREVGASGTVAGLFAATDARRGVWKAAAGTEAAIRGAALGSKLDDTASGDLNVGGINALRGFPVYGNVVWGARTLRGADAMTDQWKYIPVRRMALYIEESLNQGLKWVVFEPNDEPLWSSIRLNVGSFMSGLFRQGAFAGEKPSDAYFVKCDKDTTTEADVDRGIVNIVVGFKPLKPAEFVVLRIQQLAGQATT